MRFVHSWRQRHRNPANLYLHVVAGLFLAAGLMLVVGRAWWLVIAMLVCAWALRRLGHLVEGSPTVGAMLMRRRRGLPGRR